MCVILYHICIQCIPVKNILGLKKFWNTSTLVSKGTPFDPNEVTPLWFSYSISGLREERRGQWCLSKLTCFKIFPILISIELYRVARFYYNALYLFKSGEMLLFSLFCFLISPALRLVWKIYLKNSRFEN